MDETLVINFDQDVLCMTAVKISDMAGDGLEDGWCALITGPDPKFKLARAFLKSVSGFEDGTPPKRVDVSPLTRDSIIEVSGQTRRKEVRKFFQVVEITGTYIELAQIQAVDVVRIIREARRLSNG